MELAVDRKCKCRERESFDGKEIDGGQFEGL